MGVIESANICKHIMYKTIFLQFYSTVLNDAVRKSLDFPTNVIFWHIFARNEKIDVLAEIYFTKPNSHRV